MIDRGDYEKRTLTPKQQEQRSHLPPGVGLEASPFWDFQKNPYGLYKHMVRYFFIAEEIWKFVIRELPPPATVKLLDVGSGYGEMEVFMGGYMRPKGYKLEYTGCDIDPLRMQRARSYLPSINIVEIEPLPNGLLALPEYYNAVVCSEVYEHLKPEEGEQLLRTMAKVTQSGAVAVFTIPTPAFGKQREIPMHLNEEEPSLFTVKAEQAGWEVLNWYYTKGRTSEKAENVPTVLRSTLMAPQFCKKGNHALYVLRRRSG